MNRRTFFKAAAAVTAAISQPLPDVPSENKWIAFKDQMPEINDKFEIKNKKTGVVKVAELLQFQANGEQVRIGDNNYNLYAERNFVLHRVSDNCMEAIIEKQWQWRYA